MGGLIFGATREETYAITLDDPDGAATLRQTADAAIRLRNRRRAALTSLEPGGAGRQTAR
jgi:hypothetical protein